MRQRIIAGHDECPAQFTTTIFANSLTARQEGTGGSLQPGGNGPEFTPVNNLFLTILFNSRRIF